MAGTRLVQDRNTAAVDKPNLLRRQRIEVDQKFDPIYGTVARLMKIFGPRTCGPLFAANFAGHQMAMVNFFLNESTYINNKI